MRVGPGAMLWEPLPGEAVRCALCSHRCRIAPGARGVCGVRENRGGTLHTLVYGRLVARHVDPIEKKPLFHLAPGSRAYSVATAGCNFRCGHCQNHAISQVGDRGAQPRGEPVHPEAVVAAAVAAGCHTVAYTYTEPTVFAEYALDCMALARRAGLRNAWVTNGYQTPEALAAVVPLLDAANVDLKAMSGAFYREVCGARLEPVLETLRALVAQGVWVEVTTLVIPGHNDDPEELRATARFLAGLSPDLPWHVTGFYPAYRLTDAPPTPVATLVAARQIGQEAGLRFVYAGNRHGRGGEDTACPSCGGLVVGRTGFLITHRGLDRRGGCAGCGQEIPGLDMGGTP